MFIYYYYYYLLGGFLSQLRTSAMISIALLLPHWGCCVTRAKLFGRGKNTHSQKEKKKIEERFHEQLDVSTILWIIKNRKNLKW